MNATTQIPNRLKGLIWRDVDDGTVIVSPTAGKVRVLNPLGSTIWELLDGQHTVADIEEFLSQKYHQVPRPQISEDLQIFLDDLTNRGLLTWN